MRRSEATEWISLAAATAALGAESAGVIGLRLAQAATGDPKAADEACRMWSEKVMAFAELQTRFFTGSLGSSPSRVATATVRHYRRKVAANRRRLRAG